MLNKLSSFAVVVALFCPAAAHAAKPTQKALQKPVKVLINAVRYSKDQLALRMLAPESMSKALCGATWDKMSAAQKKEFSGGLMTLVEKITFKKARDIFKHIDAILYGKPEALADGRAKIRTTIVVHRAYKKTELVIDWVLVASAKKWTIVDTISAGESTIEGIREEEIDPLLKKGGVALLLQALRDKVKEVAR